MHDATNPPVPDTEAVTAWKRAAATQAAGLVRAGMAVGLGHGTTTVAVVEPLAARWRRGELAGAVFVPAAHFLAEALRRHGLPVGSLDDWPVLDLAIDGADEIDGNLDCVKGGGGALLYEKILAQAARRFVLVADAGKLSPRLGTRHAVPVEVTPFALAPVTDFLAEIGGHPALRLRPDKDPMRTERGNVVLDCAFGPIADPAGLAAVLDARAGVAGHGLFLGLASLAVVAGPDGVRELRMPPAAGRG